jgi:hypothetical protein
VAQQRLQMKSGWHVAVGRTTNVLDEWRGRRYAPGKAAPHCASRGTGRRLRRRKGPARESTPADMRTTSAFSDGPVEEARDVMGFRSCSPCRKSSDARARTN